MSRIKITENQYKRIFLSEQSKVDKEYEFTQLRDVAKSSGKPKGGYVGSRYILNINGLIDKYYNSIQSIRRVEFTPDRVVVIPSVEPLAQYLGIDKSRIESYVVYEKPGGRYVYFYVVG